jgi:stage II sporulation protein D
VITGAAAVRVSGSVDWRLYERDEGGLVARGAAGEAWRVEREGDRVRAVRGDGVPTVWKQGGLVARPTDDGLRPGFVAVNGRNYRGELIFLPGDSGVIVVNRVRMDDYLKGVVPLEIGTRAFADSAAVQAQAVTARSYAYIHLGASSAAKPFDVTAGVQDQVYRGADVESPVASAAVDATRGLVLKYAGRVVNAPYSSTCGGTTAAADEIWRTEGEPYLRSVSDRVPGTDRFYCDISPRFRWTRTIEGSVLRAALDRYLATYAAVPGGVPGAPQAVMIDSRTPSGRVRTLKIATDRGNFVLRGNDIRYVLRAPGGEILNSTYFSVETLTERDGSLGRLTLRGSGNGHGVGMCQWGAIGRARAGHDFRAILGSYYPGTTVGVVE